MKKRLNFILVMIVIGNVVISGCSEKKGELSLVGLDEVEREEMNFMQPLRFASDGSDVYNADLGLVYRFDLEERRAVPNCITPGCQHEDYACTAFVGSESGGVKREGNQVYVLGNKIFKIGRNKKEEVGGGHYGDSWSKILFGNYIAYSDDEDIVVEDLRKQREVMRFQDVEPYIQGSFYYRGGLWYVTKDLELVRLDLENGKKEMIEKQGATRAGLYREKIYIVKVDQETGMNFLVRLDTDTMKKEKLVENVFYYNMKDETLYYTTWPERNFCKANLDGSGKEMLREECDATIWSFPEKEKLLMNWTDCYVYYMYDVEKDVLDEENVFRLSDNGGEGYEAGSLLSQ